MKVLRAAADLHLAGMIEIFQCPGRRLDGVEAADHALRVEIGRRDRAVLGDVLLHLAHHRAHFLEALLVDRLAEILQEKRHPIAPCREQRIMRLQHRPVAVEHVVKPADRRIGARHPGDLVIAQAGRADAVDLHHAKADRALGGLLSRPQRTTQAQTIKQEGAGEILTHGMRSIPTFFAIYSATKFSQWMRSLSISSATTGEPFFQLLEAASFACW